jgi:hypothetical protein
MTKGHVAMIPSTHRTSGQFAGWLCAFTLLAALCPAAKAEDELGRLFFTPERRQALDRQRQFNIQEKQEIPEDPTLTINGVVTRSSGKRTVWLNGVAQNDNEKPSGVTIIPNRKAPGKVVVQPSDADARNAKVGETVNRNTGEATDLLGDGEISINRAATVK